MTAWLSGKLGCWTLKWSTLSSSLTALSANWSERHWQQIMAFHRWSHLPLTRLEESSPPPAHLNTPWSSAPLLLLSSLLLSTVIFAESLLLPFLVCPVGQSSSLLLQGTGHCQMLTKSSSSSLALHRGLSLLHFTVTWSMISFLWSRETWSTSLPKCRQLPQRLMSLAPSPLPSTSRQRRDTR